MKGDKLNPKQRRFVSEYLIDQNGTQAAIRAGYSKKTAQQQSYDLLLKPLIKNAVEAGLAKIEGRNLVTAEYVINGLKEVAERCMEHVPVMEFDRVEKGMVQKAIWLTDKESQALTKVGVFEFDSSGANKALELLGKHLQIFTDRVEHSGAVSVDGLFELVRKSEEERGL